MDIRTMKNDARSASRSGSTSYQEELNRIARAAGFTHWGSLLAAQPNPSFGYRYNPDDGQNARDLQQARNDSVHVLYVAEDDRIATSHVIGMANSIALLPTVEQAQGRLVARPPAIAVLDEELSRDWKDMRKVTCEGIADLPRGAVAHVERLQRRHVEAARGTGVILIGAVGQGMAGNWPRGAETSFLTLFIPTQDTGQLGRIYSREEQEIIYATTMVQYVLPSRDVPTVGLAPDRKGETTIRRGRDRPSATRSNPNSLWADDYVRPSRR